MSRPKGSKNRPKTGKPPKAQKPKGVQKKSNDLSPGSPLIQCGKCKVWSSRQEWCSNCLMKRKETTP